MNVRKHNMRKAILRTHNPTGKSKIKKVSIQEIKDRKYTSFHYEGKDNE